MKLSKEIKASICKQCGQREVEYIRVHCATLVCFSCLPPLEPLLPAQQATPDEPRDALWFCTTDVFPRWTPSLLRSDLESIGFVFCGALDSEYDVCDIPQGWTKKPMGTWHASLHDARGNTRAYVYLGLAGTERVRAGFERRFSVSNSNTVIDKLGGADVRVPDGQRASVWLDINYPRWLELLAYWDDKTPEGADPTQ